MGYDQNTTYEEYTRHKDKKKKHPNGTNDNKTKYDKTVTPTGRWVILYRIRNLDYMTRRGLKGVLEYP